MFSLYKYKKIHQQFLILIISTQYSNLTSCDIRYFIKHKLRSVDLSIIYSGVIKYRFQDIFSVYFVYGRHKIGKESWCNLLSILVSQYIMLSTFKNELEMCRAYCMHTIQAEMNPCRQKYAQAFLFIAFHRLYRLIEVNLLSHRLSI